MLKKRLFSALLCVCMVVGMLPIITQTAHASTGGHTKEEAVTWARNKKGTAIDYDGAYGAQCVDLIFMYYDYLGQYSRGYARDYMSNSLPNGWKRYTPSQTAPQPGDIVVFDAGYTTSMKWSTGASVVIGSEGHVAIVVDANASYYKIVEYHGTEYSGNYNYPLWDFSCVIRPDWHGSQPTVNLGDDFYAYICNPYGNLNLVNRNENVQLATVNRSDPRQIWHFVKDYNYSDYYGNHTYKMINMYDNLCIDAPAAWGRGANVGLCPDYGEIGQRWVLYEDLNGQSNSYQIAAAYESTPKLALDVAGAATNAGTNIQLWDKITAASGPAQTFQITKVNYIAPSVPAVPKNVRVSADSSGTTIRWDAVLTTSPYDSRAYHVLVYDGNNSVLINKTVYTNSCSSNIVLSPGNYRVSVQTINTKYAVTSSNYKSGTNVMSFSIVPTHTITLTPTAGGTVYGSGTYQDGKTAVITASPYSGYHFVEWRENGQQVSTSASYQFTVTGSRTLTGVFEKDAPITPVYTVRVNASEGGVGQRRRQL